MTSSPLARQFPSLPTWINQGTVGVPERSFRPGDFAYMPAKDQIFFTAAGKAVNINAQHLHYPEFLDEDTPQPVCDNCGTEVESINSWRRTPNRGGTGFWCNACGAWPRSHEGQMRPAIYWKDEIRPRGPTLLQFLAGGVGAQTLWPATMSTSNKLQEVINANRPASPLRLASLPRPAGPPRPASPSSPAALPPSRPQLQMGLDKACARCGERHVHPSMWRYPPMQSEPAYCVPCFERMTFPDPFPDY